MKRMRALACVLMLSTLASQYAGAAELYAEDLTSVDIGGDVKSYTVGVWPYKHAIMPEDPFGQGMLDLRLKLEATVSNWLRFSLHHSLSAVAAPSGGFAGVGFSAGASGDADAANQLLDLTWAIADGDVYQVGLRIDRAIVAFKLPNFDLTIGRQPISFGSTFFFNPMDLVTPFSPTVIDREYKPGIDAVRADAYVGTSGTFTAVAAYTGRALGPHRGIDDIELADLILAMRGGLTLGVFDVGLFAASVRGDTVLGLDTAGGLFGVGLRGESTFTFAKGEAEPFVRAAIGADKTFDFGLSVSGEVYAQGVGADKPENYVDIMYGERYQRGEIWALGRYYAALSLSYELLPIINLSVFGLANLLDRSALVGPSLAWSISDEAALSIGGYYGVGERPKDVDLEALIMERYVPGGPVPELSPQDILQPRSEFGITPAAVFVQMRAYF